MTLLVPLLVQHSLPMFLIARKQEIKKLAIKKLEIKFLFIILKWRFPDLTGPTQWNRDWNWINFQFSQYRGRSKNCIPILYRRGSIELVSMDAKQWSNCFLAKFVACVPTPIFPITFWWSSGSSFKLTQASSLRDYQTQFELLLIE